MRLAERKTKQTDWLKMKQVAKRAVCEGWWQLGPKARINVVGIHSTALQGWDTKHLQTWPPLRKRFDTLNGHP